MHLSDFNLHTMEIRHLVAVYAVIILVQGGYFAWTYLGWRKINRKKAI